MNDQAAKVEAAKTESMDIRAGFPEWTKTYKIVRKPDGRLYLEGKVGEFEVTIVPPGWKTMRIELAPEPQQGVGTLNYGVNMAETATHAGKIETNDATFGNQFLAATQAERSQPLPTGPATEYGQFGPPAIILAIGVIGYAAIKRFKKSS